VLVLFLLPNCSFKVVLFCFIGLLHAFQWPSVHVLRLGTRLKSNLCKTSHTHIHPHTSMRRIGIGFDTAFVNSRACYEQHIWLTKTSYNLEQRYYLTSCSKPLESVEPSLLITPYDLMVILTVQCFILFLWN
jgi:hypothetical protein